MPASYPSGNGVEIENPDAASELIMLQSPWSHGCASPGGQVPGRFRFGKAHDGKFLRPDRDGDGGGEIGQHLRLCLGQPFVPGDFLVCELYLTDDGVPDLPSVDVRDRIGLMHIDM